MHTHAYKRCLIVHIHTHAMHCMPTCTDATLYRYPWHVVFTGIRILIESGGVFDGDYFTNDENSGKYAGYQ